MIEPNRQRRSLWPVVLVSMLLTLLMAVLVRNLADDNKSVEQRIPRLYSAHDSAFYRAMGIALGPSIVGGNQVQALFASILPVLGMVRGGSVKGIAVAASERRLALLPEVPTFKESGVD